MKRLRVLLAASEAWPLIKTGGLADVVGALPGALRGLGVDARLVLPAYPAARAALPNAAPVARSALYGADSRCCAASCPPAGGADCRCT